jgi:hypothetical protein
MGGSGLPKNTPASPHDTDLLGRENHANLMRLRAGWEEVYTLSVTWPDNWKAVRIGEPQTVLEASTAAELREAMMADHLARPLPRRPSASD